MASLSSAEEVRLRFEKAGQAHVFDFFGDLDLGEKAKLLEQLEAIKVDQLANLLDSARSSKQASDECIQAFSGHVGRSTDKTLSAKCRAVGIDAINEGKVAALVLAGGQGTRLGFDGPKGMYDIGLPSGRTLFQMMAERIKKLSQLAATSGDQSSKVPFYIMTSPINHEDTVAYFQSKEYFGLGVDNVRFFKQGALPCLTDDGKIILESKGAVSMAPDGNGGIYPALVSSGALAEMASRGILYLHVFSIDNALVKPADPVFVGYCISQNADCGNKVVWKAHAHEKVGVIASRGGPCVVEYSEITKEMAELTDAKGMLVYGAANICNHFYTLDFIRSKILPNLGNLYHIASKKIPYFDPDRNETITPTSNNGIKLETFIFDVFPLSESMAVFEATREEEFAPVKNEPGSPSDSPDTARELISSLCKRWVIDAGGELTGDVENSVCEIAPTTSYAGEGLADLVRGTSIHCPFSL